MSGRRTQAGDSAGEEEEELGWVGVPYTDDFGPRGQTDATEKGGWTVRAATLRRRRRRIGGQGKITRRRKCEREEGAGALGNNKTTA